MKLIGDELSRQLSFAKRRNGLIKKALELAVLCGVDVVFLAFSPSGRLSYFSGDKRIEDVLSRFIELPDCTDAGEATPVVPNGVYIPIPSQAPTDPKETHTSQEFAITDQRRLGRRRPAASPENTRVQWREMPAARVGGKLRPSSALRRARLRMVVLFAEKIGRMILEMLRSQIIPIA
ncbi:hypothetical protein Dimus_011913 [Dionaea muscipula]